MLCLNAHLAAAVLGGSLVAGCGLISSDVTNFDLKLPDKKFTIDASGWQVDASKAPFNNGMLASVPCNSPACSMVPQACSSDCTSTCDTVANSCMLSLDVSRPLKVD